MATPHIGANRGDIAETVLLPGDPLRAKYIAETFLEDVVQYNNVRGMLGFTGTYKGKRISVQGTGMGVPSIGIYTHELITHFGCKNLIRIGTAGSTNPDVKIRDVVVALASSSDSNINKLRFNGADYAPTANAELLFKVYDLSKGRDINLKAGNVLTSDTFYGDDPESWKKWSAFGVLCVEMETAQLYTTAAKHNVRALTLLTISDSLVTGEATSAEERQTTFNDMIKLALDAQLVYKMKYSDEKIREYIAKINKLLPKAYIPYSKFPVAAVIVDQDDNEHYGVNVENASYGLSICAERNAIASSILKGMKKIKLIVITARTDEPISPCGMCRQVIREFATKDTLVVLASGNTDKYLTYTVDEIIPYSFGPEHLI